MYAECLFAPVWICTSPFLVPERTWLKQGELLLFQQQLADMGITMLQKKIPAPKLCLRRAPVKEDFVSAHRRRERKGNSEDARNGASTFA